MSPSCKTVTTQLARDLILRTIALGILCLGLVGCCEPLIENDKLCGYIIPIPSPAAGRSHPEPSANAPTPSPSEHLIPERESTLR